MCHPPLTLIVCPISRCGDAGRFVAEVEKVEL
jgi:hypothetical protein